MLRIRNTSPLIISRRRAILVAVYVVVVLAGLMYLHYGLTPDVLVFVLLGAAVIAGHTRLFVRDWGVFLLVLILWQQTGPVAQWANFPVHMRQLVIADKWLTQPFLHGVLPQVWLQRHLYHPGHFQWYDILSSVVYGLHFPEPLLVGFAIWLHDRTLFRRFAVAFLVLAGLAFAGYILVPTVPPWMAAGKPYYIIPHVTKIFNAFNDAILQHQFGHTYQQVIHVQYDEKAAMPSLHAAFPILSALYLRKSYGNWGLLMLIYAAVMWFAVVYMAEHWVADVLVGVICALVAYALVEGVVRARAAWSRRQALRATAEETQPALVASSRRTQAEGK